MDELLHSLENKIRELIDQQDKLKDSSQQLHHGKSLLIREKEALLAKQLKSISHIESLVTRLKALDK